MSFRKVNLLLSDSLFLFVVDSPTSRERCENLLLVSAAVPFAKAGVDFETAKTGVSVEEREPLQQQWSRLLEVSLDDSILILE